jgi:hypothetical protein
MDTASNTIRSGSWSIQWIPGELCAPATAMNLLEHLASLGKNADSAKIFQGTDKGQPAVYIVTRWSGTTTG